MGFFIRKSFRAGPIRLNLSKRGLGVSVGVTGARIGLSARGRAYAAGGRGGLYFRQNLGSSSARSSRMASAVTRSAVTLETDTGATYRAIGRGRPAGTAELLGPAPSHHLMAALFGIPAAAGLLGVLVLTGPTAPALSDPTVLITSAVIGLLWIALVARQLREAYRGELLGKALAAAVRSPDVKQAVPRLRAETKAAPEEIACQGRAAYLGYLDEALADRRLGEDELTRLEVLETSFQLPLPFIESARVCKFREVYLEAVSDHALDESEEETLAHIRDRLEIPDEAIAEELETISRLVKVRGIREGDLLVVETQVRLQKGEVCHFEGEGRLVKRRTLRSFQQDGQRYKEEGLVVDKEGTLLVTNKRLLLVHEGTTSVRLDKILDVELDLDRNLISVLKDGAQKPVLFTTPDAQRAAAVLAAVVGL